MHVSHSPAHDAVIVGAGPVGLFLACELRLAGCSVLVLERANESRSPIKDPPFGLRGLSVPTVESFDRRGLLDMLQEAVAARGTSNATHSSRGSGQPGGHFAGVEFSLDQVDTDRWPYRLAAPVSNVAADMASIEVVLEARAQALGVDIRRGCEVVDLEQSDEHVLVRAAGESFRGRWLVGCDGGRSVVRKAARFGFAGTEPEFTGYFLQVELADPGKLTTGRHRTATGMYIFTPPGTVGLVDFDGGSFHRSRPITRDHVETVLRKVSGTDVAVTSLALATTWTDRAFQATEYRKGRVLLAGDAAHIHSPMGGQGLNLGLGDAMNLGWKLASVIQGDAQEDLLDSYACERQPVGAQILDWSRAQVDLMRPSGGARALEAIMRDLMATRDGATYFAERVWGVGLRYELKDAHPLAGRSAPDFELTDGTRLSERLRNGGWLLLDFESCPALESAASIWGQRLSYVAVDAKNRMGLGAVMVRPDGVVACARDASGRDEGAARAVAWQQMLAAHLSAARSD